MDIYRIMLGLDGKAIKNGDRELRIADIIADALLVDIDGEEAEQKLVRGRLARKIYSGDATELSDEEKSLVKLCANKCVRSPLILSYIHDECA